ncbi:unnamed protein product [Cladocopium goreaui]|uniref:Uncharacterized protein n=1 Tax=Cladocopium goreaui TaxID=2562237 RepID=A0A9P1DSL8_9DINO|nr:unnamed protein product [Cladocopium goreaui]
MLFAEFKLRLSSLRFARLLCALDDTGKDGSLPKCRCMQDMCNGPDNFMMWKRTRLKPEAPPSSCSPPPNEKATASCSEPKRQTELTMKDNDDNERPFLKVLSEERRWRPRSRSSRRAMACYGVLVDVFEVEVRESHLPGADEARLEKCQDTVDSCSKRRGHRSARGAMGTLAMPRKRDEADEARMKLLLYVNVALQFQQLAFNLRPTPVYLCTRLQSQSRIIGVNNFSSARSQATFTAFYVVTSRFPFLRLATLRSSLLPEFEKGPDWNT